MNRANTTPPQRPIARLGVVFGLSLLLAAAGGARAEETTTTTTTATTKTTRSSWSFNFGNWISYGANQTKGSGVFKEEVRTVANFSRLTLALPATVTLSQGPVESLSIDTDDNLLPLMTTRVDNGELVIEGEKNRGFSTRRDIRIRLVVKSLDSIQIRGSGDILGDQLKTDKLDIAIAGSGDVRFKSVRADRFKVGIRGSGDVIVDVLDSKTVDTSIHGSGDIRLADMRAGAVTVSIKGSGDVTMAGSANTVDVEVMGSGDVRARRLIAREAAVKVQSSGDVSVHASEKLTASVSGSGDIRYAGSPASVSRSVRGSGSIEAL